MEGHEDSEDSEGYERQDGGRVAALEVGADELGRGVREPLRGIVGSHDRRRHLLRRARASGGRAVVELAIGNGRVAILVAQATGRRVIGIDSSPGMLAQARARAAEAGVELDLRDGDMRDLALDEPAALIYCPFRALLHLPTWADRRRTSERVAASLRPDGRFAWNAFAFDHRLAARLDGEHQEEPTPHTIRYSIGDNRIDIIGDDGATNSLWWATKNEWLGLLDVAGLELEALYGGFDREPFADDSREYVFVARCRLLSDVP